MVIENSHSCVMQTISVGGRKKCGRNIGFKNRRALRSIKHSNKLAHNYFHRTRTTPDMLAINRRQYLPIEWKLKQPQRNPGRLKTFKKGIRCAHQKTSQQIQKNYKQFFIDQLQAIKTELTATLLNSLTGAKYRTLKCGQRHTFLLAHWIVSSTTPQADLQPSISESLDVGSLDVVSLWAIIYHFFSFPSQLLSTIWLFRISL